MWVPWFGYAELPPGKKHPKSIPIPIMMILKATQALCFVQQEDQNNCFQYVPIQDPPTSTEAYVWKVFARHNFLFSGTPACRRAMERLCRASTQDTSEVCGICLEPHNERVITHMRCNHIFHTKCIEKWLNLYDVVLSCMCCTTTPLRTTPREANIQTLIIMQIGVASLELSWLRVFYCHEVSSRAYRVWKTSRTIYIVSRPWSTVTHVIFVWRWYYA